MNTLRSNLIGLIAPSVCLAMVHAAPFKEADKGTIRSMVDQAIVRLNRVDASRWRCASRL